MVINYISETARYVRRTPQQYADALNANLPPWWSARTVDAGPAGHKLMVSMEDQRYSALVILAPGRVPDWSLVVPAHARHGGLLHDEHIAFEDIFVLKPLFELRKLLGGAPLISEETKRRDDAIAREYDRAGSGGFTGD